jgi:hypothetical protein
MGPQGRGRAADGRKGETRASEGQRPGPTARASARGLFSRYQGYERLAGSCRRCRLPGETSPRGWRPAPPFGQSATRPPPPRDARLAFRRPVRSTLLSRRGYPRRRRHLSAGFFPRKLRPPEDRTAPSRSLWPRWQGCPNEAAPPHVPKAPRQAEGAGRSPPRDEAFSPVQGEQAQRPPALRRLFT